MNYYNTHLLGGKQKGKKTFNNKIKFEIVKKIIMPLFKWKKNVHI